VYVDSHNADSPVQVISGSSKSIILNIRRFFGMALDSDLLGIRSISTLSTERVVIPGAGSTGPVCSSNLSS
jgi:hypothetical protein